jgi:hypothetical protein
MHTTIVKFVLAVDQEENRAVPSSRIVDQYDANLMATAKALPGSGGRRIPYFVYCEAEAPLLIRRGYSKLSSLWNQI